MLLLITAKDIPGSSFQPMTLQRWGTNTPAISSPGWDYSEACILPYDLTLPHEVSVTHCGKLHNNTSIIGYIPFPSLGYFSTTKWQTVFLCFATQLLALKSFSQCLASGEAQTETGFPSGKWAEEYRWTVCRTDSLILPYGWKPPEGSPTSTPPLLCLAKERG